MILGLLHSEATGLERLGNFRRTVFYQYPNGAAPLIALLSMLKTEDTNDPTFTIYEKRFAEQRTTTASANAAGPFTATGGTTDATVAGFNMAINSGSRIKVADTSVFRVGHIIQIKDVPNGAATAIMTLKGLITLIVDATSFEVRWLEAYTSVSNDTDANALEVTVIGNAASEAQVGAALAPYQPPSPVQNYTQIFRTPFQFSGTVLPIGLKFDKTGPYKDKAKDATLQHAEEMEKAYIFGTRSLYINPGTGLPLRTTGGILWFLQQWEAGAYGTTPATLDTDDNKRIITNAGGSFDLDTFTGLMERVFRTTSNQAQEKLCLCGSGFLTQLNKMFLGKGIITINTEAKATFGWDIVTMMLPQGTVHFKTHPLFSQNGSLRYSGLFLDVWNLIYRPMQGRDTTLLKNRQPNNADYREDEWFGEHGLELRFPESFMFINNVRAVTP
jgi:3D (Asp-Asp-Asp) domain-containing protein